MSSLVQKTIKNRIEVVGNGLHTGEAVKTVLCPAPENQGILFHVTYKGHTVQIPATIEYLNPSDCVRNTTLNKDGVKINTIEHLLSACYGLGITNLTVEVNGCELPILDGSAQPWVEALTQAEMITQNAEAFCWEIMEPISIVDGDRSLLVLPCETLKITCTSTDNRRTHTQHLSLTIDPNTYASEIAAARTFTIYEDIEPLLKLGKIKGGTLDCAVVIKGDKYLSNGPMRYPDEFVRHKILDILGDLSLVGHPIKGHIIAIKTGHALNARLTKAILAQEEQTALPLSPSNSSAAIDIHGVLKLLPHRYPFAMVDRVLALQDNTLVALKNITINEPCFTGHFPENPVFPGVLQVEAMAQAAGILLGIKLNTNTQNKQVFFMSADKVKFRHIVQPGDQLRIEAKLLKIKNNCIGYAEAQCLVADQVVSSAELMFMLRDL